MTTTILRNYWYVAATTAEVGERPLGRAICGEPVVLFRQKDGSIAALTDRCPHRKFALSKGTVVNGEIQCGYHGLRFDGTGTCTIIPSQDMIPPQGFNARPYPVVEKHALIFVWIGDPARADHSLLPDWSENTATDWTAVHGYHHINANYQLILDNLLDLTHLAFVHHSTLGAQGSALAIVRNPNKVDVTNDAVRTRRDMLNDVPSPVFRATKAFEGHERIDRFQSSWFRLPGYIHIVLSGAAPVGSGNEQVHHTVINSVTPETERSTHYFWSVPRRFAIEDQSISDMLWKLTKNAFDEDLGVLEIQQQMIESDTSGDPLRYYKEDKAGMAVRRIISLRLADQSRLIAAE